MRKSVHLYMFSIPVEVYNAIEKSVVINRCIEAFQSSSSRVLGSDCMNSSSIDSKGKNWIYVSKNKNKEESKLTPMLLNCKCTNSL